MVIGVLLGEMRRFIMVWWVVVCMSSESVTGEMVGWAVWVESGRSSECVAVLAESEESARRRAVGDDGSVSDVVSVDGPFEDCEPGVWEFEFVSEHRERVVVEAPYESYAREVADMERSYAGEFVHTVHEEVRKL